MTGIAEADSKVTVLDRDAMLSPQLSGTDWSVTPSTALADGAYRITVKAIDPAGNVTEVSGELLK